MKLNLKAKMHWFILISSKNCDSLGIDVDQILGDVICKLLEISSSGVLKHRGSESVFISSVSRNFVSTGQLSSFRTWEGNSL